MKRTILIVALFASLCFMIAIPAAAGPVLERITAGGELVVGMSGAQPPMNATTKSGEIIGLDVDLAREIAAAIGVKLKFAVMPFAELLPALETGRVDMVLSGLTMTPQRNRKVAFVGPYFVSGKGILATSDRFATLQQADGLNTPEVTLAALKNSTSQKFAQTLIPKAKLNLTDSYAEAIDLLFKGKTDVVVADFPFCALTAKRHQDKGLIAGKSPLTFEPLGIAMPEDALLINLVQNMMFLLQGSGQLKDMHEKWLNGGAWINELP